MTISPFDSSTGSFSSFVLQLLLLSSAKYNPCSTALHCPKAIRLLISASTPNSSHSSLPSNSNPHSDHPIHCHPLSIVSPQKDTRLKISHGLGSLCSDDDGLRRGVVICRCLHFLDILLLALLPKQSVSHVLTQEGITVLSDEEDPSPYLILDGLTVPNPMVDQLHLFSHLNRCIVGTNSRLRGY